MQVDYEEIRQIIQNLCMMNNRFLNKMLDENIEAAEIFLRVIMNNLHYLSKPSIHTGFRKPCHNLCHNRRGIIK